MTQSPQTGLTTTQPGRRTARHFCSSGANSTQPQPGGDEALYAVNADGGDFRQMTHCRGEYWSDGEPAWSPGGDRIAFSCATGSRSAPGLSRVAIDVPNADDGLADEIDAARAEAVKGLRAYGYSWAETGSRLGITRQAAQQRWR